MAASRPVLGLFIGTLACGFFSDRYGRRKCFVGSLLWYTVANIMVAPQTDAFGLNLWRLISGLGLGVETVTIGAYLSEMAPKNLRGKAFACSQAIGFSACRSRLPRLRARAQTRSGSPAGAGWC